MTLDLKGVVCMDKTNIVAIPLLTHSRIIYGNSVETCEPYSRYYMSESYEVSNYYTTIIL